MWFSYVYHSILELLWGKLTFDTTSAIPGKTVSHVTHTLIGALGIDADLFTFSILVQTFVDICVTMETNKCQIIFKEMCITLPLPLTSDVIIYLP